MTDFYTANNATSLIPEMTSNTSPKGEAFASNEYSQDRGAWKAFTENVDSIKELWLASASSKYPRHVGYKFEEPTIVNMYAITARKDTTNDRRNPKVWKFQGSHNGENYVTLHKHKKTHWDKGEVITFSFQNTQSFRYYRLLITENIGEGGTSVQRLEMFFDDRPRCFLKAKGEQDHYVFIDGDDNISLTQELAEAPEVIDFRNLYYYNGKRISLKRFLEEQEVTQLVVEYEIEAQEEEPYIRFAHDHSIRHDFLSAEFPEIYDYAINGEASALQILGERPEEFVVVDFGVSTDELDRLTLLDNSEGSRYLFSPDKEQWYAYSQKQQDWQLVEGENITELTRQAMCKFETLELSKDEWQLLGDTIYIGIIFPSQVSNIEGILANTLKKDFSPEIEKIHLNGRNTLPIADVYTKGQYIIGTIKDEDENSRVGYRISLEEGQVIVDELNNLQKAPRHVDLRVPDKFMPKDKDINVYIEFQDEWGTIQKDKNTLYSLPKMQGLILYNSEHEVLSNGEGEVVKPVNFGELQTNKISKAIKVLISNETPFDLFNIVAFAKEYETDELEVFISENEKEITVQQGVIIPELMSGDTVELYIRLKPKTENTEAQQLYLSVYANEYSLP